MGGSLERLVPYFSDRETTAYVSHSGMGELSDNQVRCVLEDDFKHIWVVRSRESIVTIRLLIRGVIIRVMEVLQIL